MASKSDADRVGEALQLQQINILEIEYLKDDLGVAAGGVPEQLRKTLDRLLSHSVKTSKILQELTVVKVKPENTKLHAGTA